jgi:hypothetical protein
MFLLERLNKYFRLGVSQQVVLAAFISRGGEDSALAKEFMTPEKNIVQRRVRNGLCRGLFVGGPVKKERGACHNMPFSRALTVEGHSVTNWKIFFVVRVVTGCSRGP